MFPPVFRIFRIVGGLENGVLENPDRGIVGVGIGKFVERVVVVAQATCHYLSIILPCVFGIAVTGFPVAAVHSRDAVGNRQVVCEKAGGLE